MSESSYKRYRDNWDLAFGLSDQANSPIDSPGCGNNESTDEADYFEDPTVLEVQPEQAENPTTQPKKKRGRPSPWLKLGVQIALCIFTLGAFIAAAVYAWLTYDALKETRAQTGIAEQQSRPWIKITEATLNSPETLTYHSTIMGTWTLYPKETLMFFAPAKPATAFGNIRTTLHMKNIGKSVAQDIRVIAELFFDTGVWGSVDKEQDRFCTLDEVNQHLDRTVGRSALFPDDTFEANINTFGGIAKEYATQRDGADWLRPVLIGCVIYQFPRNFQTRMAYVVSGLETSDVRFGQPLTAEEIRFMRDEHYEYAK